jgi:hypothetical protein
MRHASKAKTVEQEASQLDWKSKRYDREIIREAPQDIGEYGPKRESNAAHIQNSLIEGGNRSIRNRVRVVIGRLGGNASGQGPERGWTPSPKEDSVLRQASLPLVVPGIPHSVKTASGTPRSRIPSRCMSHHLRDKTRNLEIVPRVRGSSSQRLRPLGSTSASVMISKSRSSE